MATSALHKLQADRLPKIVTELPAGVRSWAKGIPNATMVISTPKEVDGIIRRVPKGKVTTINDIRAHLAARHGTTLACPVTTGLFVIIAAKAAEELRALGRLRLTPYWRVLKLGGELNEKFPGGAQAQRARLEAEGVPVVAKGRKWIVPDFERLRWSPP